MAKDEQFEYESLQDNESIGKYLQALIDGFEKNKITFSSENNTVVVHPSSLLQFAVTVRKKDNKNKLSIKISWKDSKRKEAGEKIFIGS
ncbi:MAG: hypothetical protein BWK80_21145 [Desulfobacteraceae bacterium IS3]|nr:MAG: hypothetical protein BWK80_21145 [Desulfobacteraceae bacterium IS3]